MSETTNRGELTTPRALGMGTIPRVTPARGVGSKTLGVGCDGLPTWRDGVEIEGYRDGKLSDILSIL